MNTATPSDASVIKLLGGHTFEGVSFTKGQAKRLRDYYGFDPDFEKESVQWSVDAREKEREKTRKEIEGEPVRASWMKQEEIPPPLSEDDKKGLLHLYEAGRDVGCFRQARTDGLRLMAYLSEFLGRGEDPVRFIQGLCADAGFDAPDEWEDEEEDEDEG